MSTSQMIYKVILPIFLALVFMFYFASSFIKPAPKKELTIATGSTNSNYYKSALKYQKLLAKQKQFWIWTRKDMSRLFEFYKGYNALIA